MTSSDPSTSFDVIVIGAGISGLTAAYYSKRVGRSVRIVESSSRVGGMIRSEKKDGYLLEHGPNTILPTLELMELINDLDLNGQMLLGDTKLPRFIQYAGKLYPAPLSPATFLKSSLFSRKARLRVFAEPFIPVGSKNGDQSLLEFAEERLGREVAERLLAPFVSGVWAGDATQLSATAAFPKFARWMNEKGSLIRGALSDKRREKKAKAQVLPRGLLSFLGGLETLTTHLHQSLEQELILNTAVTRLSQENDQWLVEGPGLHLVGKQIIFSLPIEETAALVKPISETTSETLREIPTAPLAVLHLAIKTADVRGDLHAFGHLIAPSENLETLGCLYISSIFSNRAPKDTTLLTVFVGGARFPKILELSDQELLKKAVLAILPILGLQKHPELLSLTRYERAIPQYTIGHLDRITALKDFEEKFSGLKFAGNYVSGISVGDVIRQAKTIVKG